MMVFLMTKSPCTLNLDMDLILKLDKFCNRTCENRSIFINKMMKSFLKNPKENYKTIINSLVDDE